MTTKQILDILKVVSWVLFIGLCIYAGAILTAFTVSLFVNTEAAKDLYMGMDLSQLHSYGLSHYIALVSLVVTLAALKAYLFFQVVKIISKVNVTHPFTKEISTLISKISTIALQIGITAVIADGYAKWLMKKGLSFTYESGGTEFLLLAGIVFVIAQIYKRGIELQSENELTI
ncbi:MAG: DUF2975 domain-containing protein [Ekhidna sp.]|uniref:DUF2975 domain-containing protein n=1 Tax=Ekhidna sp. TaxID=2608089 RepID=UPI0032EE4850